MAFWEFIIKMMGAGGIAAFIGWLIAGPTATIIVGKIFGATQTWVIVAVVIIIVLIMLNKLGGHD